MYKDFEEEYEEEYEEMLQIMHEEFWGTRPITCMLLHPGGAPQIIDVVNNDDSWSSLVGPDYVIHFITEGMGVVMHESGEILQPNVGLYLPDEDKEIIVRGSMIVVGMTFSNDGGMLPTEGDSWLCSLSEYTIENVIPNYIRSLDDMYRKPWNHG